MDTCVDLSVVIVARNEANNIARAIESVQRAVNGWPQTEILLVDSSSIDETVDIAKHYPINIVRLPASWFLSASAGRLIGLQYTRGDLVLHMDGDMELDPDWVNRSISYILEHPEVAAVGGFFRNVYVKDGQIIGEEDQNREAYDHPIEVQYVSGAALYRRSAIQEMGGHHPYIRGEQDIYLCMGLRYAGHKVVQLPYLMSRHFSIPPQSMAGSLRRVQRNLWLGYGQVPRYYLGTELFWTYLKERAPYVSYLLGVLVSIVMLLLTVYSQSVVFLAIWMAIVLGIFLSFSIKKHSLRAAILSFIARTFITYYAVRGFFMVPRSPAEYPLDAEIVQVHYHRGGLGEKHVVNEQNSK